MDTFLIIFLKQYKDYYMLFVLYQLNLNFPTFFDYINSNLLSIFFSNSISELYNFDKLSKLRFFIKFSSIFNYFYILFLLLIFLLLISFFSFLLLKILSELLLDSNKYLYYFQFVLYP